MGWFAVKKLLAVVIAFVLLAGCARVAETPVEETTAEYTNATTEPTTRFVYAHATASTQSDAEITPPETPDCYCIYDECFFAERIVAHHAAAAPLHITDAPTDEFLAQFNSTHTLTFPASERPNLHDNFVFWTDEPLRNFSLVGVYPGLGRNPFHVTSTFFTIEELLPGEAFVLLDWFGPYQFPIAGFSFIDQTGVQRYMFFWNQPSHGPYCLPTLHPFENTPPNNN